MKLHQEQCENFYSHFDPQANPIEDLIFLAQLAEKHGLDYFYSARHVTREVYGTSESSVQPAFAAEYAGEILLRAS